MTAKVRCHDYGFDCEFVLDEEASGSMIQKLRDHFEDEHGIDYTIETVKQMLTNRGYSV